jgi:hypothetical protein
MLERISTWELDKVTINYYHRAIDTYDHSGGVDETSWAIARGDNQLWIWKSESSQMVIVTEVRQHPDVYRELVVLMLAGSGGLSDWVQTTSAFADKCAEFQCDRVITFVRPELWEKFQEHGAGEGTETLYIVIGKEST